MDTWSFIEELEQEEMTVESPLIALYRLMVKNRRRYGGYLVHLGIAFITMGIIGSQNYDLQTMKTVILGQAIDIGAYRINFLTMPTLEEKQN
ncbi:hypothetical protein NDK43_03815 [Neobacillus pocheonensis]|uniref:ABC transporter permease n=1 Tax=Neobacillus pocheonensis TaxID=363869 RepID=A0ABT0W5S7_9BACI|nr:hypothetical protein [Neobacillus pocheonensis]